VSGDRERVTLPETDACGKYFVYAALFVSTAEAISCFASRTLAFCSAARART
jgi:hypothetical protein